MASIGLISVLPLAQPKRYSWGVWTSKLGPALAQDPDRDLESRLLPILFGLSNPLFCSLISFFLKILKIYS